MAIDRENFLNQNICIVGLSLWIRSDMPLSRRRGVTESNEEQLWACERGSRLIWPLATMMRLTSVWPCIAPEWSERVLSSATGPGSTGVTAWICSWPEPQTVEVYHLAFWTNNANFSLLLYFSTAYDDVLGAAVSSLHVAVELKTLEENKVCACLNIHIVPTVTALLKFTHYYGTCRVEYGVWRSHYS